MLACWCSGSCHCCQQDLIWYCDWVMLCYEFCHVSVGFHMVSLVSSRAMLVWIGYFKLLLHAWCSVRRLVPYFGVFPHKLRLLVYMSRCIIISLTSGHTHCYEKQLHFLSLRSSELMKPGEKLIYWRWMNYHRCKVFKHLILLIIDINYTLIRFTVELHGAQYRPCRKCCDVSHKLRVVNLVWIALLVFLQWSVLLLH